MKQIRLKDRIEKINCCNECPCAVKDYCGDVEDCNLFANTSKWDGPFPTDCPLEDSE